VSSVELERVIMEHLGDQVMEVAAVGVPTPGGGPELLHLFVVPRPKGARRSSGSGSGGGSASGGGSGGGGGGGSNRSSADGGGGSRRSSATGSSGGGTIRIGSAELLAAAQAALRTHLNPLFKVERVIEVSSLPRTASNKVMRRVLRAKL
jgi:acyl-coenzyme A synthetase/AMP-(fatty) acid ligase